MTATSGAPYTLYLDLPEHFPPTPASIASTAVPLEPDKQPEPQEANDDDKQIEENAGCILSTDAGRDRLRELQRRQRVTVLAKALKGAYCPCAGYGYNTLGGDRNVLASDLVSLCPVTSLSAQCKHLLAVIIANKMGKEIKTDVGLAGVAALLAI